MDLRKPSTIVQALFLCALLIAVAGMVVTAHGNLTRQNIATGFGFLFSQTGWDVGAALIAHSARDPYWHTFLVGLLNTLLLSAIGVAFATVLGVLIALARSSENRMIGGLCALYIDVFRNVPLIVQVFFWYQLTRLLPPARQAISWLDAVFLSNRGLYIPSIELGIDGQAVVAILILWAGLLAAFASANRRRAAGNAAPLSKAWLLCAGTLVAAVVLWLAPPSAQIEVPRLRGFNFVGGAALSPEFAALITAIVVYNVAFVAEIIRAGIQSVPQGQIEAARNIGLSSRRIFWKIVIPQAFRVVIPPMTNQYIFIAKESSLAVAVGYTDLFSVGTIAINHTGQSIEVIAVLMLVYLAMSFAISAVGNVVNRLMALQGAR